MPTLTEQEVQKLNEGRMMREGTKAILHLLSTRKEAAISAACYAFREGRNETAIAHIAEVSALRDLEADLTRKNKETEALERKANATN